MMIVKKIYTSGGNNPIIIGDKYIGDGNLPKSSTMSVLGGSSGKFPNSRPK